MDGTTKTLLIGVGLIGLIALAVRQDQKNLKTLSSKDRAEVMKARAYSNAASMILSGPGKKRGRKKKTSGRKPKS